ncbi:helix-turn-helix domain-containing protein [Thalassobacillus hwangdonensis]|uniref:Helix-turn-helix domain-containing protein n=1 Tax=Thalassobacillus hwangdonensis TaxID=546108 RepID=A0ABW3KZY4_9BACI
MECHLGKYIDESGLKKKMIAEKLSVNKNTLSNWIKGETYPPVNKALELGELLGVTVEEIWKK